MSAPGEPGAGGPVPGPDAMPGRTGSADIGFQWASLLTAIEAHRPSTDPGPRPAADGTSGSADDGPEAGVGVAVTIVSGFLGSGKSTLLAALLADPPAGSVIRAVVNDIGRLPFDPTLVATADGDRVELTNGCGCCVAGAAAELGQTLDRVAAGADHVVLEASGLADPMALAQIVTARSTLRLERIVAVVDASVAVALLDAPATGPILRRQLASAAAVVISHADGRTPRALAAVIGTVAGLAPGAPVVCSSLDDPAHRVLVPPYPVGVARPGPAAEPDAGVEADLVVETLRPIGSVGGERLAEVLADRPPGLLRGKGYLLVDGSPALVQFSPSSWTVDGFEGLPDHGLTVVATDRASIEPMATLLGLEREIG